MRRALERIDWPPPATLRLVAAAHSNGEVARRLRISAAEVAVLKRRAMENARLASRVQLVAFARRRGWIV